MFRENPERPSRPVHGGRHFFAIKAQLDALGDIQVFYICLQNPNVAEIISTWNMDREHRDFSAFNIHYLITDFEVNEDQPASFIIESLRNLMNSHKQSCVDQHGHCEKGCAMIVLQLINSPSDG